MALPTVARAGHGKPIANLENVPLAIRFYDLVLSLHIAAVVFAIGLPLAYPVVHAIARNMDPRDRSVLHRLQAALGDKVIAPGFVVILLAGAYLATDAKVCGEVWVIVPLVLWAAMAGIGGMILGPTHTRLADLAAAEPASGEYKGLYSRSLRFEYVIVAMALAAIFFMTAKPFA